MMLSTLVKHVRQCDFSRASSVYLNSYALSKGAAKRCFRRDGNNSPDLLAARLIWMGDK